MDDRRKNRYQKQQTRFKSHAPRTMKDSHSKVVTKSGSAPVGSFRRSKAQNVKLAEDTVEITQTSKKYQTEAGDVVDLSKSLSKIVTIQSPPTELIPELKIPTPTLDTVFEVELETTLEGCSRKYHELKELNTDKLSETPDTTSLNQLPVIGCLNFASAKNPGGGFLRGTMAQEESLAYSSALYASLKDSPMYAFNRRNLNDGLYSDYMIVSQQVPVFRTDSGKLLEEPYSVTFLTTPAVNAGVARARGIAEETINKTMFQRMDKLLLLALRNKIDILILGSWGCGVFQGNVQVVASMFVELLTTKYDGCFQQVVFSTLDPAHKVVFENYLDLAFRK